MRVTIYKQLMFMLGCGFVVLSLTSSVYWALGTTGLWMMLFAPFTGFPLPRATIRLTFPQIYHLINNPSECIQFPRCDLFVENDTKRHLQSAFEREANREFSDN